MKEKITYMPSPMSFFTRWPISTRVLTTVLNRCNKFSVEFFDIISCYVKAVSAFKNANIKIPNNNSHAIFTNNHFGATSNFSRFPHFYIGAGQLDNFILESIKTDIVFYSSPFIQDLRIIKFLLENGKKILLGGTTTLIYGINEIRNRLIQLNTPNLHNLCIVEGYIDLTTDLYDIYKRWEDVKIKENDLTTIWDCHEDFALEKKKLYQTIFNTNLGLVLTTDCWWGKCTYCTFPCVPVVDFTKGLSSKEVVKKILKLGEIYDSKNIYFFDSYMKDNKRNRDIMFSLKDEGFKLSTYTGMHLMKKKSYLEFINKAKIDAFIGLENTNTKTLKEIKKGYTFEDVDTAFDMMLKYMRKDVRPVVCVMCDLPVVINSREQAIKEITQNYLYIKEKKDLFKSEGMSNGIGFQPDLKPIRHLPKNTLLDSGLLREANTNEFNIENIIGLWALYLYMSKYSNIGIEKFDKYTNKPMVRYLPNGEKLESDLYFIDKEIIKEFSTWL